MANFKSYLYNEYKMYKSAGTYTWTKPSDIDDTKPILVHVWGAGGNGANGYYAAASNDGCRGGGGGGLAVKLIDVSSLGATETVTIGGSSNLYDSVGGTSSFGSHCSATGGNDGYNDTENAGSGTTAGANYGIGGLGIGGDVNRRGGRGGIGYYSTTSNCGGGGGGSAPAPYGVSDGFPGGRGYTYSGGGGGGIGGPGQQGNYVGGVGGSSMSYARYYQGTANGSSHYTPVPGVPGLGQAGGSAGVDRMGYTTYGGCTGESGKPVPGNAFWIGPNHILFGGGSGASAQYAYESSNRATAMGSPAGPGAGGSGNGKYTTTTYGPPPTHGGILGGGGGSTGYTHFGYGGNAGGGGGLGYYAWTDFGYGGDGLMIIQYARKFT